MATTGPSPADVPTKSTLHCPHCDHASRYDQDWIALETAQRRRLLCPACGTTVATRPRDGERSTPCTPGEAWWAAWKQWGDGVRIYSELWRAAPRLR